MRIKHVEALILLVIGCVCVWDGLRIIRENPLVIGSAGSGGWIILVAALFIAFVGIYALTPSPVAPRGEPVLGENTRAVAIASALLFGLVFALPRLGYVLSAFLFLTTYIWYFGRYRLPIVVGSAACASILTALLWAELGMRVPKGVLPWP